MLSLLPKLQFQRQHYITLNEGFDRVGRFMFPKDWTGLEALAWPNSDPKGLREEKAKLKKEFILRSQRTRDVRQTKTFGMSEKEYREHQKHLEGLENQRQEAREKVDQFGETYDARYSDALAYDRRQCVEKRLCNLIRKKELGVRFGHGTGIDMRQWFLTDNFHISFAFSYIIAPEQLGRRRRFPAYFNKQAFDVWALPFEADLLQYNSDSVEEQMLVWFRTYREEQLKKSDRINKNAALAACEEHFGEGASAAGFKNMFKSVWHLLAPNFWKKGGAPKKP